MSASPIHEGTVRLGGETYYERRWPLAAPAGHILLVHGFGEHCGRYDHVAAAFNAGGYSVYSYDQRYHGRSPGTRARVDRFERLPADLDAFEKHLRTLTGDAPFFVFAHSMGGLVTARYLEIYGAPRGLRGVVFSSPFLQLPDNVSPLLIKVARFLSAVVPWLPVAKLDRDALSRDSAVVAAYINDPLNNHGQICARTGSQFNEAVMAARAEAARISIPAYIFHGDADRLAMHGGSEYLHAHIASTDKALTIYPGGYHELFNDRERDDVLRATIAWYDARR